VGCMGHVEPEDLGSTVDELGQGGGVGVFWAECGDQFCASGKREFPRLRGKRGRQTHEVNLSARCKIVKRRRIAEVTFLLKKHKSLVSNNIHS